MYIISLDEEFDGEIKVAQPEVKSDLEARVEALEKEVFKTSNSENRNLVGPLRFELRIPAV